MSNGSINPQLLDILCDMMCMRPRKLKFTLAVQKFGPDIATCTSEGKLVPVTFLSSSKIKSRSRNASSLV